MTPRASPNFHTMPFSTLDITWIALAFALTLGLTPLVGRLARRSGMMARPRSDRWHKKPTALLGGVAIFLAVNIFALLAIPWQPQTLTILGASGFLFLVGLADDILHLKPYQKLVGQVMGAAFVIFNGLHLAWTDNPLLNIGLTIFWLVAITNAVNLLDNMDGLAAGIAAIAAVFLAANYLSMGQATEALLLAGFVAALVGFLVFNSHPASIFMGDCGSMFLGFFLAGSAMLSAAGGRSRSLIAVLTVPVLVLFVPIFDVTFVTILRKLAGRAVSQGGRDHTSHRLVALGLSERRAVWLLYGLALLSGLLALQVRDLQLDLSLALILGFCLLLTLLGVYLAGVKVYDEEELRAAREKPLIAFLVDLSYKRRIFEVLLDVGLIILAYYFANVLILGSPWENGTEDLFLHAVPVLLVVKLATFLVMGVYRGLWRYVGIDDLLTYANAVVISSPLCMLGVLFLFRFEGYSRAVFVLDGLILMMMLGGSRIAFRLFRNLLPSSALGGRRALIYGAGDGGELLLRELQNNRALQLIPVGFADDDPLKTGKVIHGLRVFGGNGSLGTICREQQVQEVVISSSKFTPERIDEILRDCKTARVNVKRMVIQFEQLSEE